MKKTALLELPYHSNLKSGHSFYGHHQFYHSNECGLTLGTLPADPDYKKGSIGLRAVDIPVTFSDLKIGPVT